MRNVNKKGFTLVELLATIVILSLLSLITIPAVTKSIKDSKNDLYDTQLRSIKDSAKAWSSEKMFSELPNVGTCKILSIEVLKKDGLVDQDIKNPLTDKIFTSNITDTEAEGIVIKITNVGSDDNNKYTYDVWNCDLYSCYNPDDEDTKTYSLINDNCEIEK